MIPPVMKRASQSVENAMAKHNRVRFTGTYTAACPACGADCEWRVEVGSTAAAPRCTCDPDTVYSQPR